MLRLGMRRVLLLLVLQVERQILVLREGSRRRRGRGSGEVWFSDGMDYGFLYGRGCDMLSGSGRGLALMNGQFFTFKHWESSPLKEIPRKREFRLGLVHMEWIAWDE